MLSLRQHLMTSDKHQAYLKCLPVKTDRLFDAILLSLDVGQVVEGVSVVGVHPKGCVVTLLRILYLDIHRRKFGMT